MTPLENFVSRLPKIRRTSNGYAACCPAHHDRQASLEISTGKDGRVLFYCHAQCPKATILAILGLSWGDLFPSPSWHRGSPVDWPTRPPVQLSNNPWPPKDKKVYLTPEQAALACRRGQPFRTWVYQTADGDEIGRVLRWNYDRHKVIRPLARVSDGWIKAHPPQPRGIYRLPEILAAPKARLWLCEGEKCADWVTGLGLQGTCTWGGSGGIQHVDLSPLAGRRVVIVPDHDPPGLKYARQCIRLLGRLGATVEVVPPRCFPWRQDIADLGPEAALDALSSATKDLTVVEIGDALDRGWSAKEGHDGEQSCPLDLAHSVAPVQRSAG